MMRKIYLVIIEIVNAKFSSKMEFISLKLKFKLDLEFNFNKYYQ